MLHPRFSGLLLSILLVGSLYSQPMRIAVSTADLPHLISLGIEPDHGSTEERLLVRAEQQQLKAIRQAGIAYRHVDTGSRSHLRTVDAHSWAMERRAGELVPHRAYPNYELYEGLMRQLAEDYADRCRLQVIGRLPSGRQILALKISTEPDRDAAEPKILLTSTMHGDELAGYPLLLFLIEELLLGYGSDPAITELLDQTEIWINPLANPDGAYAAGNDRLEGATRENATGVDLNRNFPDPEHGRHPDGHDHQLETRFFMALHDSVSFDLSANLHSGAEVFNYPWDSRQQAHPDDAWWQLIAREFAGHAQCGDYDRAYFRQFNNGITNGYQWYPVHGGRQDYVTYYHHGREATIEIEGRKAFAPARLRDLWATTRPGFYALLRQSNYGLHGTVVDAHTGRPLRARIRIPGHDRLNSEVYSKLPNGRYHRYLKGGQYRFEVSAPGYQSQYFEVRLADRRRVERHIRLVPVPAAADSIRRR